MARISPPGEPAHAQLELQVVVRLEGLRLKAKTST